MKYLFLFLFSRKPKLKLLLGGRIAREERFGFAVSSFPQTTPPILHLSKVLMYESLCSSGRVLGAAYPPLKQSPAKSKQHTQVVQSALKSLARAAGFCVKSREIKKSKKKLVFCFSIVYTHNCQGARSHGGAALSSAGGSMGRLKRDSTRQNAT